MGIEEMKNVDCFKRILCRILLCVLQVYQDNRDLFEQVIFHNRTV